MKTFLQILLLFCSVSVFGQITVLPSSNLCPGGSVNVSFPAQNSSSLIVKLYRVLPTTHVSEISSVVISSPTATTASIPIPTSAVFDTDYYVYISSVLQTPRTIQIGLNPNIVLSSGNECIGSAFQISANTTNTAYTYTWYKDEVDITNANASALPYIFSKPSSTTNDFV
jgi:hypothetical protein